jgi:HEAT repeat protein
VDATIADGRDFTVWTQKTCYDGRTTETLLAGLSSWSPAVRKRSAQSLGRREGDLVPRLLEMLGGKHQNTRYGACEALGCLGPKADPAAKQLRALLADRDPWMRILAADAVARLGPEERTASVPALLHAVAINDPADRRKRVEGALAEALFTPSPGKRDPQGILSKSLDGVDRPLLYAAVKEILKNEDGRIRGLVAPMYKVFTPEDLAVLLPDIVAAIRKPAPSGEMFAYGIRMAGLELLARLRISEGMPLCVDVMKEARWGRDFNLPARALARYGGAAKDMLPRLQGETREIAKKEGQKQIDALEKCIADIEADKAPKPVRTMDEFIKNPTVDK